MRIAVVNLTSGGLSGGYAKYLTALLPLLEGDPRVSRLDLFVPPGATPPDGFAGRTNTWSAKGGVDGHRDLRAQLAQLGPDVIFFPTARLVRPGTIPTVVMVRNMEPLTRPFGGNTWREGLRNLARAGAARLACRRATRVIAVSNHVRSFLTGRWGLRPDRVGMIYHGIDAAASGPAPVMPPSLADRPRFLFTAGSIRPARGLEDLIGALPAVLANDAARSLVIAGGVDPSGQPYAARMRALARALGVERHVVWAGHLTAPEMAWTFQHCAAFVMTSRAEACPNLALEAMSQGAVIVSTRQDPMPELFGDVATYYSPPDAGELAARISRGRLGAGRGVRPRAGGKSSRRDVHMAADRREDD